MAGWYKWLQQEGGQESWFRFLAEYESKVIAERKPAFTTILACDNNWQEEVLAEDIDKVRYTGPCYFDFDAPDIDESIAAVQRFVSKLKNKGFDIECANYYASGSKGFHVIIPIQAFVEKKNPRGYAGLPYVYKEVANEFYVDCLDLNVYSGRKGRMFRTENVERPDKPGVYKVGLTVEELFTITPEIYKKLCSKPRTPIVAKEIKEPFPNLAEVFQGSLEKVAKAFKDRSKSKADQDVIKAYKGEYPHSILQLMNGEWVANGTGFQRIATQLAVAAHALGKSELDFLSGCEGLIANHESDGQRYNTPTKRRAELKRMYAYMSGNPCYTYSVGGIKSLIDKRYKTQDLDGVPLSNRDIEENERAKKMDVPSDHFDDDVDPALSQGVMVTSNGLFRKTEEGVRKFCEMGLDNPLTLMSLDTKVQGYEVDLTIKGQFVKREVLTMDNFLSKNAFMRFTLAHTGVSVAASDHHVSALADIMKNRADRANAKTFMVNREGVDVIYHKAGDFTIVWADHDGVITHKDNPRQYKLVGEICKDGEYKSDLRFSPKLKEIGEDIVNAFFENFFQINKPEIVARMFGWYLSAFLCQIIRLNHGKFPILQVFGEAGAGKTETNALMARLHYWRRPPKIQGVGDSTKFALDVLSASSGSIPMILDEYKPREIEFTKLGYIRSMVRNNYNGNEINRGRVDKLEGKLDLTSTSNIAPLAFLGEAMEAQTAILERCIIVPFSKENKHGRKVQFRHCQANREVLSALGRSCIDAAVHSIPSQISGKIYDYQTMIEDMLGDSAAGTADRSIFNVAVLLTGLEFGRMVIEDAVGPRFNDQFKMLSDAILDRITSTITETQSEMSKTLDVIAYLSHAVNRDEIKVIAGQDYVEYLPGTIDLDLMSCYSKYARFKRGLGEEVLFDSAEAFLSGLGNYAPVINRVCNDSPLKLNETSRIHRFNIEGLAKLKVGKFA